MPSPELLAWRQARKNLKAFHKANPKLKGKYLSLRRSLGYLDEFVNLRGAKLSPNISASQQYLWRELEVYKQAYAQLRELEQEEYRTRAAYYYYSKHVPGPQTKEKLHGL